MIPKPRERWHFGPIIVTHVISSDDRIELGIWVRTNKQALSSVSFSFGGTSA